MEASNSTLLVGLPQMERKTILLRLTLRMESTAKVDWLITQVMEKPSAPAQFKLAMTRTRM